VSFVPKLKIEVVVPDDQAEKIVETITRAAKTGEIGDGKILALTVDQAVRIRTGETDIALFEPYPIKVWNRLSRQEPLSSAGTAGQLDRLYEGNRWSRQRRSRLRPQGSLRSIPNGNKIRVTGTITV
jgi:hypothetical protein